MKLLKLNNGNVLTSQWVNYFNDLKIKPFAKIALNNITLQIDNTIVISNDNNTFQIQVVKKNNPNPLVLDHPIDILLTNGNYTYAQLLQHVEDRLNYMMLGGIFPNGDPNEVGLQWSVVSLLDKTVINYANQPPQVMDDTQYELYQMIDTAVSGVEKCRNTNSI